MKSNFILSLDPSGSYFEGKGITGWCVYDCDMKKVTQGGYLAATTYTEVLAYWKAHLRLIQKYKDRYGARLHVVIEDYRLYASRAESQTNSTMETCKLIGILQYYCLENDIEFTMQLASLVKTRWNNKILEHKNILYFGPKHIYLPDKKTIINKHTCDAVRHAVHYATFKNGG